MVVHAEIWGDGTVFEIPNGNYENLNTSKHALIQLLNIYIDLLFILLQLIAPLIIAS